MVNGCSRKSIFEHPQGQAYTTFINSVAPPGQTTALDHRGCRTFDAQNTDLAIRLLYRLPRELRNRVYTFCVRGAYDDEVIIRQPRNADAKNVLLVRQPTSQRSYRWVEDPFHATLTNPSLEPQIAREMLEAYYWIRIFKCSHRDLPFLDLFLNTDRYGLGMAPSSYIRRLQVQLQVGCGAQSKLSPAQMLTRKTNLHAIQTLMELLTVRTEVSIDVVLPGDLQDDYEDCQTSCCLAENMSDIVEVAGRLIAGGVRTTVTHSELCGHWRDDLDSLNSYQPYWSGTQSLKIGKL